MKRRELVCAAVVIGAIAGGCKKKQDEPKAGPTTTAPVDRGNLKPAPAPADPVPTGTTMTGEEMAAQYATCWSYFNDRKWDAFKGCFDSGATTQQIDGPKLTGVDAILAEAQAFATAFPDGKGELQLTLVSDNHVVGILLFTGTHDGPLETVGGTPVPATHKKIGFLIGHVIDFDPKTKLATSQYNFADPSTMMAQLGIIATPHREPMTASLPEKGTVLVSKGTDTEKANLAALQASTDAFNKRDAAAYEATRTDGMTFYDSATPNDVDHAQWMAGVTALWKSFSDLKSNLAGAGAAGDYVVSFGELTGTNDGDLVAGKVKATGKSIKTTFLNVTHYTGGKVDKAWRFTNGLSLPMQLGLMK